MALRINITRPCEIRLILLLRQLGEATTGVKVAGCAIEPLRVSRVPHIAVLIKSQSLNCHLDLIHHRPGSDRNGREIEAMKGTLTGIISLRVRSSVLMSKEVPWIPAQLWGVFDLRSTIGEAENLDSLAVMKIYS